MNFDLRTTLISIVKVCEKIQHLSSPNARKLDQHVIRYFNEYKHKIMDRLESAPDIIDMIKEDVRLMTDDLIRELNIGKLSPINQTITLKWDYKSKSSKSPRIMISSFYRYVFQLIQSNPILGTEVGKYGDELLLYVYELAHIVSNETQQKALEIHIRNMEVSLGWKSGTKSGLSGMFEQLKNVNFNDGIKGILEQFNGDGLKDMVSNTVKQLNEFNPDLTSKVVETVKGMYQDENIKRMIQNITQEHKNLDESLAEASKDDPLPKPDDDKE